jgi:uncharacterized protein YifE (UPF0438 family)
MSGSFSSNRRFYDDKHFPRGFSRSGVFTLKEADLLERLGQVFKDLEEGSRQPSDDIEIRFVQVCKGEVEAQTPEEKVWLKFKQRTGRRRFHGLVGTPRGAAAESVESDDVSVGDTSDD